MSPLYDFRCQKCGDTQERFIQDGSTPVCCGELMTRLYSVHAMKVRMGTELWIERLEDIGKAQSDRGERRTFVHPRVVGAT